MNEHGKTCLCDSEADCLRTEKLAVDWLTVDLPAMRAVVRSEHPDWTPTAVVIEAIRRVG